MKQREILDSWKDIAAFLKRDARTCQRWEKELDLPVHRLDGSPKARVFAYKDELERWTLEKAAEREANGEPARWKRSTRVLVPAAALALAAAGFFAWRYFRNSAARPNLPSRPTVAVLDFENLSKDASLDWWRDGLAELLITGLSQSRFITVLTRDQADSILEKLKLPDAKECTSEELARIAAEGGLTELVTGSYLRAGDKIVITLTLLDPRNQRVIARKSAECLNQDEIVSKANDLTLQLKQDLNLSGEQISADAAIYEKLESATTGSVEAYKYYLEGRKLLGRVENAQSIVFMEKAVEIDPGFAMAYRSMATAYNNLGDTGKALKYGRKALAESRRLPALERMLIEGSNCFWEEDYAGGIEVLERVLKLYPEDLVAHLWLANMSPDLDRAIALKEFVFRRNKTANITYNLAYSYMLRGLYRKAEDVCRSFLRDVEENAHVRTSLYYSHLCRGQYALAFAEMEKLSLPKPGNATYRRLLGDPLLLRGDFAGAEEIYQQAFRIDPAEGRFSLMMIDLARGKFNEAAGQAQQELAEAAGNSDLEKYAYWDLVTALEKGGHYEEAGRAWSRHLRSETESRRSAGDAAPPYLPSQQKYDLFIEGRIQAERKAFAEAETTAERLRSLAETSVNPRNLRYAEHVLGLVELGKGNARKAAGLFARACGRVPFEGQKWEFNRDHALFFDGLARALYESGELDKARPEYEKIVRLTVGRWCHGDIYAKAFYMLGKVAERQGDKIKACENYGKFLDLWKDADPGLPEVEDARARLRRLVNE